MKRKCLLPECKKEVTGRADALFCSTAHRNTYNNRLNSDQVNQVRNINNALRKNWRILKELLPSGKDKIPAEKFTDAGFNFHYCTSFEKGYYFCYNYRYSQNGNIIHLEKMK